MTYGTLIEELTKRGSALRDNHLNMGLEYWLKLYEFVDKVSSNVLNGQAIYNALLQPEDELQRMDEPQRIEERSTAVSELNRRSIVGGMKAVLFRYTGGCELERIRNESVLPSLENGRFFRSVVDKHRDEIEEPYLRHPDRLDAHVHELYVFLAWCVCFDVDVHLMKELAPIIAKPGVDRLLDVILERYDPGREIAADTKVPKVFGQLTKLIDASPENRIKLIERHLDKWAVTISKLKGFSGLGGTGGLSRAKSNADLVKPEFITGKYAGWWAWEVALFVRVFGIDDSSFADHPLYPVELARFRSRTAPVSLWPLDAKETESDVSIEEEKGVLETLLILASMAAGTPLDSLERGRALMVTDEEDDYFAVAGILYAAIEEASIETYGDPPEIISGSSDIEFLASMSTSNSAMEFEQRTIDRMKEILSGNADRYRWVKEGVRDEGVAHLLKTVAPGPGPVKGALLPIESGDDWAAWIDIVHFRRKDKNRMLVKYVRINEEGLLQITGKLNDREDVEVGEVVDEVERLVKLYAGHGW